MKHTFTTCCLCFDFFYTIPVSVTCRCGEVNNNSITNNRITLYPSPNNGTFEITVPDSYQDLASAKSPLGGNRGLFIYNSLGQLIYSQQINSSDNNFTETISLDNISSGIYSVQININGKISSTRFIKN